MISYQELKAKHEAEVNAFPLGAAFSKTQFAEMMANWGLTEDDTDKIYSIGAGCFIRKSDSKAFGEMLNRHGAERQAAVDSDTTGDGYVYQMFAYELANHEYGYTYDFESTLDALDLTLENIIADKKLRRGFNKALRKYGAYRV